MFHIIILYTDMDTMNRRPPKKPHDRWENCYPVKMGHYYQEWLKVMSGIQKQQVSTAVSNESIKKSKSVSSFIMHFNSEIRSKSIFSNQQAQIVQLLLLDEPRGTSNA